MEQFKPKLNGSQLPVWRWAVTAGNIYGCHQQWVRAGIALAGVARLHPCPVDHPSSALNWALFLDLNCTKYLINSNCYGQSKPQSSSPLTKAYFAARPTSGSSTLGDVGAGGW